ncbi:DNA repair protein RAD57 [Microdochium trichocladiopsis]|uniref:DNA repair protein RAD57 n=1 Tax=Microdochium trichocladiopsis TaxID=1682393 RepID=A0A9P8YHL5_9PEZI|nr:DNA repair protein RAD57 [Microdochium trichocladiopsis]KAH7040430.1 DNA repair protein RAD57 [Microdochium trichocladiopsis]
MTDLSVVLPGFPVQRFANLLPALDKHLITTTDLITLDVPELGKRTQLPLLDLKRLCNAVLAALHADLGVAGPQPDKSTGLRRKGSEIPASLGFLSVLDTNLDSALGGGIPAGYITEITGESGAGKTQFLLTLLLTVQLPAPHGLGRPALYISTEAPLSTKRLSQILNGHPFFKNLGPSERPSLDNVISAVTPDLESQDHILSFQVPVLVARHNIGLIILDSVAANYRAEFERGSGGSNLATRGNDLIRLGRQLHDLAREHNLAVVVANQVADRFTSAAAAAMGPRSSLMASAQNNTRQSQDSPLASRSYQPAGPLPTAEPTSSMAEAAMAVRSSMPEPMPEEGPPAPPALLLDHQQRWFTGWGDELYHVNGLKTPSLGLVWSTQIASRIALYKRPVYGRKQVVEDEEVGSAMLKMWRRWMKVVFAPHVAPSGPGLSTAVEFEITMEGLRTVDKSKRKKKRADDAES